VNLPQNGGEFSHSRGLVFDAKGAPVRVSLAGGPLIVKPIPDGRPGLATLHTVTGRQLGELYTNKAGEIVIEFEDLDQLAFRPTSKN